MFDHSDHLQHARNFKATVTHCYKDGQAGVVYLEFSCPEGLVIKPGQFIMLKPLILGDSFFRAFSIAESMVEDYRSFGIWFNIRGRNTEAFAKLEMGDRIDVRGPLGKPMPIDPADESYVFVGGGIGISCCMLPAKELARNGKSVTILFGNKKGWPHAIDTLPTSSGYCWMAVVEENLEQAGCAVKIITEDGQGEHHKGLVTDLLAERLLIDQGKSIVVACGPELMLEKVADLAKASGNKCYVFLERKLACGVGSCKGCPVFCFDESGNEIVKHVCLDNPFNAREVNWGKLIPKYIPAPIVPYAPYRKSLAVNPMDTVLIGQQGRELYLKYPITNGAGCLSLPAIRQSLVDTRRIGMYESKGAELRPRLGNPGPRVAETFHGMLNSIGRESDGIDNFIKEELPRWLELGKPVSVNISADFVGVYGLIAAKLGLTSVAAITLNVSCLNVVKPGGIMFGKSPDDVREITALARESAPDKFIIVKLPAEADRLIEVVLAAKQAGADAMALPNTIKGMDVDIWTRRPALAKVTGGWSSPAVLPKTLAAVYELYSAKIGLPIIAMGGIYRWQDAAKLILAGANVVAPASRIFSNHNIFNEIFTGLSGWMRRHGARNIQDMVGKMEVQEL